MIVFRERIARQEGYSICLFASHRMKWVWRAKSDRSLSKFSFLSVESEFCLILRLLDKAPHLQKGMNSRMEKVQDFASSLIRYVASHLWLLLLYLPLEFCCSSTAPKMASIYESQ